MRHETVDLDGIGRPQPAGILQHLGQPPQELPNSCFSVPHSTTNRTSAREVRKVRHVDAAMRADSGDVACHCCAWPALSAQNVDKQPVLDAA